MTEATPLSVRRDEIMSWAVWAFCVDGWSLERHIFFCAKLPPGWDQWFLLLSHFLFFSSHSFVFISDAWLSLQFYILALILFYSPLLSLTCQLAIAGSHFGRCSVEVTLSKLRVGVLGDHCIFNPDLVNGTVTVVSFFLLLGDLVPRGLCHSLSKPPRPSFHPIITNYSRVDRFKMVLQEGKRDTHTLNTRNTSGTWNSFLFSASDKLPSSLFVRSACHILVIELAVARPQTGGHLLWSVTFERVIQCVSWNT